MAKERKLLEDWPEHDYVAGLDEVGFKILTIWSDTPIEENIEICKQFILNEIK